MSIIDGKFPYGCSVYSGGNLRDSKNHEVICEFESVDIDNEKKKKDICKSIEKKYADKHVWALYGSNNKDQWICLQVGSKKNDNVVNEILDNIECMRKDYLIRCRVWRSKFHSDVFKPKAYIMSDIDHQKYQLMKEKFVKLMFVEPKRKVLGDNYEMQDKEKIYQYIEVKYACITEPLFWNAFGNEHSMVEQFKGKNA